jgi:hypothetical protein
MTDDQRSIFGPRSRHEVRNKDRKHLGRRKPRGVTGRAPSGACALLVSAALGATLPTGCAFAVDHPAITAGTVAGTLALGTCNLASDNLGGCLAVGGGAGAFLALVAAAAIWLGGDGHSVAVEEQPQPLPADDSPQERQPATDPTDPNAPDGGHPATPATPSPTPTAPTPTPTAPTPTAPPPTAPTTPTPTSPAPTAPTPPNPAPPAPKP